MSKEQIANLRYILFTLIASVAAFAILNAIGARMVDQKMNQTAEVEQKKR